MQIILVQRAQVRVGRQGLSLASDPPQARVILEKATRVSFKQVDDLASVWCECGELELRHENYDQALRLLRVLTTGAVGRGCHCGGSGTHPPSPASVCFCRRQQHCLSAGLNTSMARSLCRTACTSP